MSYDVSWTATDGQSGALDSVTTSTTIALPVGEIQAVNITNPEN
ncbi:hypothetical protein [Actinomyces oricola]|nr:hypothetical protein [Actinomyces oricola]